MSKKQPNNTCIDHHIQSADLVFNAEGTPISSQFSDIYFNCGDGIGESTHVFINGNKLPDRWKQLSQQTNSHFVIAETGFGSGLNFLLSWQLHQKCFAASQGKHYLHFISVEKHPLSPQQLTDCLKAWPQLQSQATLLIEQYPLVLAGCHRLTFADGSITLDLHLGDIQQQFAGIFSPDQGYVDAWFLDGFAPSKNEQMWTQAAMNQVQRLAKHQATLATFSCARIVKDHLTAAGFTLIKQPGFGNKREMLTGKLIQPTRSSTSFPFYFRHPSHLDPHQPIAIIGGGIAAATLCYALVKQGFSVELLCQDPQLAQGASKNRQAAFYPLLQADNNALSEFYAHAFLYARREYQQLYSQGFQFDGQFCGVLLQAHDKKSTQQQHSLEHSGWWSMLYQKLNPVEASQRAQLELAYGGHLIPLGGWINPASLIKAYLDKSQSIGQVTCHFNTQVRDIQFTPQQSWRINQDRDYQAVIVCAGHKSNQWPICDGIELTSIRGQVSDLPATEQSTSLAMVLCNQGYTTPVYQEYHSIGASFIKGDLAPELRETEHQRNLERCASGFDPTTPWLQQVATPDSGQVAFRCASADHLPVVGAIPNVSAYHQLYQHLWKGWRPQYYPRPKEHHALYILSALGARGICSAPLAAEILAAQLTNRPYPVSERVLNALNPNRGLIKKLKHTPPNPN